LSIALMATSRNSAGGRHSTTTSQSSASVVALRTDMESPTCGRARRAFSISRTATALSVRPGTPAISRLATSRPTAPRPARPIRNGCLLFISSRLSTGKVGFSLLHEGPHALRIVGGQMRDALQVALEIELRIKSVAGPFIERPFGEGQPLRRSHGKVLAHFLRFAGERRIVHAFPDQAPLLGFFSGKRLGQQCEPARASRADEPRQNPRPA